jgi:hypothetical protein
MSPFMSDWSLAYSRDKLAIIHKLFCVIIVEAAVEQNAQHNYKILKWFEGWDPDPWSDKCDIQRVPWSDNYDVQRVVLL